MRFIQLAFTGRNDFLRYLGTFVVTVFTIYGLGQVPYTLALWRAGVPSYRWNKIGMEEAIDLLGKNTFLACQLAPFAFALGVLMLCMRLVHGRPVLSLFTSRSHFDWQRFFLSFFVWGGMLTVMLVISVVFFGTELKWNYHPETFWMLLAISLFILPLQTTFEEALFRGYLFQGFGTFFRRGLATLLFTGVIFGLLHSANPEVQTLGSWVLVYYVASGIFLGLLTLMDEGMELSLGFHAMNNIFAAALVTNNWQVFRTDALLVDLSSPAFGKEAIVTLAVCYPLLVLLYARIYRWKNWKGHLWGKIVRPADKPSAND